MHKRSDPNDDQSAINNHQSTILHRSYEQLLSWCLAHNFAGHDPFDALNSQVFQATPLNKSRTARLIWTQVLKRTPADLRAVARVPEQRNAKGLALIALAQLARYRKLRTPESAAEARKTVDELLAMKLSHYSGAAWGYNFDWQSRNFFASRKTPTIVATAFSVRALLETANEFDDAEYLSTATSSCNFILKDLPRPHDTEAEICFSYAPNSYTRIHNANLLAAEVLAGVGARANNPSLIDTAARAARYVINRQQPNGSWSYGEEPAQAWVDNFHTAFILFSLKRVIAACSLGSEFNDSLKRGYDYWRETFFLADGWPKYYHDDPYPADAHAAASAIVTFLELAHLDPNSIELAERVARWSINNLRDARGYFYYQKRRFYTVKKPYMRWSQAWMLYGLGRLLECQ